VTAEIYLHVVRHGQSSWNAQHRIQGQTPHIPLTPAGEDQAREAARQLKDCGATAVYTSDLRRAVQTAIPIAQQLGVMMTLDSDLRERSLGELEGSCSDQAWAAAGAAGAQPSRRIRGGESVEDVTMRVRRFLHRVRLHTADGSPVVAVTHGDTACILVDVLRGGVPGRRPWATWANGQVMTVHCRWQGEVLSPVRE
jgi:broad specificity phosphatase PhoE